MSSISSTAATPSRAEDDRVYTLDDLKSWGRVRPGLPPSLAVLGHPVAHSVSPQMHNAALAELAKKYPQLKEWRYFKFEIEPAQLADALRLLLEKEFVGVNLTVPHKMAVVSLLGQNANGNGAINTLHPDYLGSWYGVSTDPFGLKQALSRELDADMRSATVVLLGAGGAAQSAAQACLDAGCAALWIGNRSKDKLQAFLSAIAGSGHPVKVHGFDLTQPPIKKWPANILVINATTLGLKHDDPLPFDVKPLGKHAKVFDMIYSRDGSTGFVAAARAHGLKAADGLGMLIWQGASSLSIWVNVELGTAIKPEDVAQTMMNAACKALALPPRHA